MTCCASISLDDNKNPAQPGDPASLSRIGNKSAKTVSHERDIESVRQAEDVRRRG